MRFMCKVSVLLFFALCCKVESIMYHIFLLCYSHTWYPHIAVLLCVVMS